MQTKNDMNCRNVQKILIDFLEGSLDDATNKGVEKHLESCAKCFDLFQHVRRTYTSYEKVPKRDPGPFFAARVMERYHKKGIVESNTTHRIIRILQPIAASILIVIGVGSGIYLGKNLAATKTVVSAPVLNNESLETYASEIYLDDLGEQSVDNLINNE